MSGRNVTWNYGMHKGRRYVLRHCPMCHVLLTDRRTWAWHLFLGDAHSNEYVGSFRTKREAMAALEETPA